MALTCSKCSRVNPDQASYCYYDGSALGGASRNGGPVAIGAQAFATPFVFPTGRSCRSFDELSLACQQEWNPARDLLKQGYLESFFGGMGRMDLVMAAKEAGRFPDPDRGLDQLLSKLPSNVLASPKLKLETTEINLGQMQIGQNRNFEIHLENQGMRLLYGTITCADANSNWLTLSDHPGTTSKNFEFRQDQVVKIKVCGDRLRANNKPLEAKLVIDSNGGQSTVTVRTQVLVKPYPAGSILAGAKSPRQVAEKAKLHPKESAPLFEKGEVAAWYKTNGWTYPVQGPPASGLGAVQQYFEALGLTPAPKVDISHRAIQLQGKPGEQLTYQIEVKSEEKRPVYAHGTSSQPWVEVSRAVLNGRVAVLNLRIPTVPDKPGETLKANLTVHSNGNQRFIVPVVLQVGGQRGAGAFAFTNGGAGAAAGGAAAAAAVASARPGSSPNQFAPSPSSGSRSAFAQDDLSALTADPGRSGGTAPLISPSRRRQGDSMGAGILGLILLLMAVGGVVAFDLIGGKKEDPVANIIPDPQGVKPIISGTNSGNMKPWTYRLKDSSPRLTLQFNEDSMRFGLFLTQEWDPKVMDRRKRLTYWEDGKSNNTVVKIGTYEYLFGYVTPRNRWARGEKNVSLKDREIGDNRRGKVSVMDFGEEQIRVTQHVEIVPGASGYLDTCLVWYTVENRNTISQRVGLRILLDTFIGANDGVPITIPGEKDLLRTMRNFGQKEIPTYIEVLEKDDPKDTGTVVQMGLKDIKLPGIELEDIEKMVIARWPGINAKWEWSPIQAMNDPDAGAPDSSVTLYWAYMEMNPKEKRHMVFTYGLSKLEIEAAPNDPTIVVQGRPVLAVSVPASVMPNKEFIATVYGWNLKKGDKVKLNLPASGLSLAPGESLEKTVDQEGQRILLPFKVKSGTTEGEFPIDASSGTIKAKPVNVKVKTLSIFG